jgi:hypothetical protein
MILKKRMAIGGNDQLRRRFAGAVRITSAQRIGLAVAVVPFAVFVAFVGGDENRRARFWRNPERLQQFKVPMALTLNVSRGRL